ncbi:Flp pilus assembly protein CpaB [Salinarimonas ramus]|uniref:Flp pilus assembly protein CpaB n=1 Tax=Salinarimonas ramus TaxID=690164 RepID=A0A917V3P8_9HYPH|nr:Flp pilus assembly protein CpaB [Salinarimonas ramus]GGK32836.1 Flp pilus assembly protein CpaB [Salinarimonas ramus]
MKRAQLAVLGLALAAGAGAMLLMSGDPPPPPEVQIVTAPAAIETTAVLVAAAPIPMGQTLAESDLRWQDWPADAVPQGMITRADGMEIATGAIARQGMLSGEPIRRERLIRSEDGGFMSAILPAGMRAVSISIDSRGSSSAGGFILPEDRVDIIRTFRDESAAAQGAGDVMVSETILRNVRVLAIGKNVQVDDEGNSFVDGEHATLELSPRQAEAITLAQRTGQLSLALRSLADAAPATLEEEPEEQLGSLNIVRFGVSVPTPVP